MEYQLENIHVYSEDPLLTPTELKEAFPLSKEAQQTVLTARSAIKDILDRQDPRLFVVVGPCSIHDVQAARDYAGRLKQLATEVEDTLLLVMRVYFEKPRTQLGWQGLINDPYLDQSYQIEDGLRFARELLLDLAKLGVPAAGEALDLVSPQYVQDLISWTAIGARTTESQAHRKMASGFSSAVGFKNGTNGDLNIAINAILSAAHPSHFLSVNPPGQVAVVRTGGNPHTHIVLRGGSAGPNYQTDSIAECERLLETTKAPSNIMVDCSHANSGKDPQQQPHVMEDLSQQIVNGNRSIVGLMIESNIEGGNQSIPEDLNQLKYGVSVTDACLDWEQTENAILKMRDQLREVLPKRIA